MSQYWTGSIYQSIYLSIYLSINLVENKKPCIANLATKAALNTKATEIENKIPFTKGFIINPEFKR